MCTEPCGRNYSKGFSRKTERKWEDSIKIQGAAQKRAIVRTVFSGTVGVGTCCHLRCDICAIAFSNYVY